MKDAPKKIKKVGRKQRLKEIEAAEARIRTIENEYRELARQVAANKINRDKDRDINDLMAGVVSGHGKLIKDLEEKLDSLASIVLRPAKSDGVKHNQTPDKPTQPAAPATPVVG
jgi:hypothetical protein